MNNFDSWIRVLIPLPFLFWCWMFWLRVKNISQVEVRLKSLGIMVSKKFWGLLFQYQNREMAYSGFRFHVTVRNPDLFDYCSIEGTSYSIAGKYLQTNLPCLYCPKDELKNLLDKLVRAADKWDRGYKQDKVKISNRRLILGIFIFAGFLVLLLLTEIWIHGFRNIIGIILGR